MGLAPQGALRPRQRWDGDMRPVLESALDKGRQDDVVAEDTAGEAACRPGMACVIPAHAVEGGSGFVHRAEGEDAAVRP